MYSRREGVWCWAREWGLPEGGETGEAALEAAYLDAAIKAGRGGTRVFGLRLMQESLHELSRLIDRLFPGLPSDGARLEKVFGRLLFVHLSRSDKLAQAISLTRAQQSGLWHVGPDGREVERLAPPAEPRFDFDAIDAELRRLRAQDAAWTAWFAEQEIEPMRVRYETLAADPAGTLRRLCRRLGVPEPPADPQPGVAKLADGLSAEWVRRYREMAGADAAPPPDTRE